MNHIPISSKARPFIVGHVGAAMMIEQRIRDLSVTAGGVNILVPCPLWSI